MCVVFVLFLFLTLYVFGSCFRTLAVILVLDFLCKNKCLSFVRLYTVHTFLLRLPLRARSTDHDCNTYGMAESNSEGGGQNGRRQL